MLASDSVLAHLHPRLQKLRAWWLGLAVLVLLGGLGLLGGHHQQHGSVLERYQLHHSYFHGAERQLFLFVLLLVISYTQKQAAWWVAVIIIGWKLIRLIHFYLTVDYYILSTDYNGELMHAFSELHLRLLGVLLFGTNPLGFAFLTGLYTYWLIICGKVLISLANRRRAPKHSQAADGAA